MNVLMVRSQVKAEHALEVEVGIKRLFTALQQAQPEGIGK